jgi:UDP-glucose 4-epimerase
MKILLTGSTGFIGSHLYNQYNKLGNEVKHLDKVFNSQTNNFYLNDLTTIFQSDLVDLLQGVDVVNHHAAHIDVRTSIRDPIYDAQQNITNTLKLLEACVQAKVPKFIFASSGGAIGEHDFPESPYGVSKLTIEKYLYYYYKQYNLLSSILRYSNVYGPGQKGGVISLFIPKLLNNEPITINGGQQIRDFVYVDDVVKANVVALSQDASQVYSICSGQTISITDLAYLLKSLCNSQSKIIINPYIKGEVMETSPEPTTNLSLWQPETELIDGLQKTISYFQHIDF